MNKIDMMFSFVLGASVGSILTWEIVKYKFNLGPLEEIIECDTSNDDTPIEGIEGVKKNAKSIIDEHEYVAYNKGMQDEKEGEDSNMNDDKKPYVITPDEYDCSDYEPITLNYYADGVLTDIYDNIIEDIDGTVGFESLEHFGEYEEDTVYVRDDSAQTDYEILRDSDEYYDKYPDERNI